MITGSIQELLTTPFDELAEKPTLLVSEIKKDDGKLRLKLSDDVDTMFAVWNNPVITLEPNSLIHLLHIKLISHNGKKMMMINDAEIVGKIEVVETKPPMKTPEKSPPPQQFSTPSSSFAPSPSSSLFGTPQSVYREGKISKWRTASPSKSSPTSPPSPYMLQNTRVGDLGISPISALNPYSNKWIIKAKITSKSEIRTWKNEKGEGKLFTIDLIDLERTEIKATFFKESVDKFYSMIQPGKVYRFSGGSLKPTANKQASRIKNPYELSFDLRATIHPCLEEDEEEDGAGVEGKGRGLFSDLTTNYQFVKIDQIEQMDLSSTIDLLAVVLSSTDCKVLTSNKNGSSRSFQKRELLLLDESNTEIKLTIWGNLAQDEQPPFNWNERHPKAIVAIKSAKIQEYNGGRTLSLPTQGLLEVDPDFLEAKELFEWFEHGGRSSASPAKSLSAKGGASGGSSEGNSFFNFQKRKTFGKCIEENLGYGEKPEYVETRITLLKAQAFEGAATPNGEAKLPIYPACPTCGKKVIQEMGGDGWRCEKCNLTLPICQQRYMLSMMFGDHTAQKVVGLFNDLGESLLGVSAQELFDQNSMDPSYADRVFQSVRGQSYIVRMRLKAELVKDVNRVRFSAVKVDPLDPVMESRNLLAAIAKYTQ